MKDWKCYWYEDKRMLVLERNYTVIKFKADKVRKYMDKHGIECKTVGQFKTMMLNSIEELPKSYYTVKTKKQEQMSIA